jgi:hypothetical protein
MGMRARVLDDIAVPCSVRRQTHHRVARTRAASQAAQPTPTMSLIQIVFECAPKPFSTAATLKEQAMSGNLYSISKQLVFATAVALGASSVALADDNSMNPFNGESYKYFRDAGQFNLRNANTASAPIDRANVAQNSSDNSMNPFNGDSYKYFRDAGQFNLNNANMASASTNQTDVAQNPSKESFSTRLARFFHP